MPAGRPCDYKLEFCEIAHTMSQAGATHREIADALDCAEGTFYRWMHEHPELREATKLGKESADDRVEHSLYRRAVGYSFDAIKIMQYEGSVVVEPYVEHVPPDVNAASLWLRNRRPELWRDKQNLELSGDAKNPVRVIASTLDESA